MEEMMNEVKIFEGNKVEILEFQGQVLFNPYHVGKCLEISADGVRKAITRMSEKQVIKLTNSKVADCHFRKLHNTGENFLTESGVYKLVFKSHKPNAERFTDWIADEVLPSIRKNGGYIAGQEQMTSEQVMAKALLAAQNIISSKDEQIAEMQKMIQDLNNQQHIGNKKPVNPYGISKNFQIEERKKELYSLTSKVAGFCKMSQTKILHYMYRTLEEDLGIVLDAYKSVYISQTGKTDACMMEVIVANEQLYASAVEMNKSVIERKQIYG